MQFQRMRYALTWRLRCDRFLYPVAILLRPRTRGLLVRQSSEIAIEGYPRSGNTFAVQAFQLMNDGTRIAHHLHSPVQVSRALSFGVPIIVLVRKPEDAVASVLVQAPYKSPREALKEWNIFYRLVLQELPRVVLAPFEEVTTDLASVIRRVNAMHGTRFVEYENRASSDAVVFREIDKDYKEHAKPQSSAEFEEFIGRPSDHRAPLLELAIERIHESKNCEALLIEARRIYADLRRGAPK